MDRVPVIDVDWNEGQSAMAAELDGITIIWTPNNGPIVQAPIPYPGVTDELDTILVHPIPENIDSQLETYPAEDDLTWQDCILVFPKDSGVPPLYLVFAKPAVRPLEVGLYSSFSGRPRNGTHLDHMPSQKALAKYLRANDPGLLEQDIQRALGQAALLSQGIEDIPTNNTAVFNVLQNHGMLQPTPDGKAIWRATVMSSTGWSHMFTFLRLAPS